MQDQWLYGARLVFFHPMAGWQDKLRAFRWNKPASNVVSVVVVGWAEPLREDLNRTHAKKKKKNPHPLDMHGTVWAELLGDFIFGVSPFECVGMYKVFVCILCVSRRAGATAGVCGTVWDKQDMLRGVGW